MFDTTDNISANFFVLNVIGYFFVKIYLIKFLI